MKAGVWCGGDVVGEEKEEGFAKWHGMRWERGGELGGTRYCLRKELWVAG